MYTALKALFFLERALLEDNSSGRRQMRAVASHPWLEKKGCSVFNKTGQYHQLIRES